LRVLIALILFISPAAFAAPYIEYKNEYKFLSKEDIHHLRFGYKTEKNFYIEAGPRTEGYSSELGYKIKRGSFTFKGKWEGSKTEDFKHKLETEVRYEL
jgi:hypothetical protein